VAGRVVQADGTGAGGIAVSVVPVTPDSQGRSRSTATDEQGHFSVEVSPGLYRVRVGSRWTQTVYVAYPVVLPSLTLRSEGTGDDDLSADWTDDRELERAPPLLSQIEGKAVEHRLLGDPVAGAWAWVEGYGDMAVRSAADGTFRLPVPNAEGLGLRVEKPGYMPGRAPALGGAEGEVIQGWSVRLHPAAYLQGRVVDGEGDPVAAEVETVPAEPDRAWDKGLRPPVPVAHTDREGNFFLPTAPGEPVDLRFTAPGHVPETVRLTTPGTGAWSEPIRVSLDRSAVAVGQVLSEEGQPIAGARVSPVPWGEERDLLRRLAGRKVRSTAIAPVETDGGGEFLLEDLPPGRYSLAVTAEGFEPVAVSGLTVTGDGGTQALGTIFLAAAATVSGEVVDAAGDPVPEAEVYVALVATDGLGAAGRPGVAAHTDAQGRFTVGGLAGGSRIQLVARRDGYLSALLGAVAVPAEAAVRLELKRAARLTGRVTDDGGDPVPDARVTARPASMRGSLLRSERINSQEASGVTTDADGVYRMVEAVPGANTLTVKADCCRPERREVELPLSVEPTVMDLTLRRGASLAGRVLAFDGRPVARAQVGGAGQFTLADEEGGFRLAGVTEEPFTLTAHHPRHGRARTEVDPTRRPRVEIRFAEAGRLAGRVTDDSGNPVAEAQITTDCEGARGVAHLTSDASGRFEFTAQPGECTLRASHADFPPSRRQTTTLEAGATVEVVIPLPPGLTLHGRLLGAEAFDLARAEVAARASGQASRRGRMDTEGRLEIAGLSPATWRVVATLPDGRRAEAVVEIRQGEGQPWVDLELDRGHSLRGEVSVDGRPLAGAWVSVSTLDGMRLAHTLAGPDGSFEVRGLMRDADPGAGADPAAGRARLSVTSPPGDLRWSQTVEVGAVRPVEVAIHTGALSGRVIAMDGGPGVADAAVRVEPLGDARWLEGPTPPTGPEGGFGPWRLPEGRYRVTVRAAGFTPAETELRVERGRQHELIVPLAQGPPG